MTAMKRGVAMSLDVAVVLLSAYVALLSFPLHFSGTARGVLDIVVLYCLVSVCVNGQLGMYRELAAKPSLCCRAALISTCLTFLYLWATFATIHPFTALLMAAGSVSGFLLWRVGYAALPQQKTVKESPRRVLIVGANAFGRRLAAILQAEAHRSYAIIGFIDNDRLHEPNVLGGIKDLAATARYMFVHEVVLADFRDSDELNEALLHVQQAGVTVTLVPELPTAAIGSTAAGRIGSLCSISTTGAKSAVFPRLLKRALDFVVALSGLCVISPLILLIAAAIKFDSPGPVLYRSYRIGRYGKRFLFLKFRTMTVDADLVKATLQSQNERKGATFKMANDPRVTRVGKFLRKYSLDELPQLWNVVRGEMSLVGPRPHPLDDCSQYGVDGVCRLAVTPGITGLWQIKERGNPSFDVNLRLDLQYIQSWSLFLDLKILLQTIPAVFHGAGQ